MCFRGNTCSDIAQEVHNWSSERAIEDIVAAQKGNIVSSGRFALPSDAVRVNCVNNHTWTVSVADLLKGKWCARCAHSRGKRERSFQALSAKVEKFGAVVVTDIESYRGTDSVVLLRCSKGHEWKIKASTVLFVQHGVTKETFCHVCSPRRNAKKSLEHLKEIVRSKGGECLADFYLNSTVKLPWRCAEGHEWLSTAQIVLGGSWCPTCSLAQRSHNMGDLQSFAKERGGMCLSAY